jgi:C-terminal processing protease CtpA/Prc
VAQIASDEAAPGQEQAGESAEGDTDEEDLDDPDMMVMTTEQYKNYLENVGRYMNEIIILSHYGPDGKLDGLLLAKVPRESEAWKRGLKEGDIVMTVQGTPVTDTSTASKVAWEVYKNADYTLELGIIRNGEEETLMYEIWPQE